MKGITITKGVSNSPSDDRGDVFELFRNLPGKQVTLYTRKQGSTFANHFHTGIDPSKDPELFFLISGQIRLYAKNRKGEDLRQDIDPMSYVIIEKDVYHEMEALTDVIFIEYRATLFDPAKADSYSEADYSAV
ncbi:MAG: hypothetical protein COU35_03875 [Candidatus Magasanikbacteria bacterium CG10_big_fil_rev_8_21_14_0_10_47_10]|uniref:Cupin 2 conserved barrel domain-containing protein n=1 Tax=Candidatus Magasanikbacteria bacterium CG10_big_fil_rev_8_21_14_0_10_47_10 TaxID=1974652 RepID=A0A2H0TPV6_9BACT|nr:MAG: hypothetical protein COU35_03875 [Candidatus Magasanikbacteria bacterium CG10_big_fil_rev_8_21_14_0_10_47_10]